MSENCAREPWEYTLHIPNDARAVAVARHTLRLVLVAHGLHRLVPVAELLGTELVTNAVTHTKGPAALRLCWDGRTLRIGVWDTDPTPPSPSPSEAYTEAGRGLALVRACSDGWGWHRLAYNGKHVWCDLAAAA
ncbi:ATP-binding protein [Streptomyces boncukensis]|uniref:ATP-binding protein n=1 Tax=Streptomyces boncukensis TaxID=2711219 RepID=A0A6G4X3R6_9ACTN|nr:ATP-binding protein [Streptomyces boncukensis]NGO72028.1 ATP-binding protein [Streptomyces boncukensis]